MNAAKKAPVWREVMHCYLAPKMEEHFARWCGFTLRVRGPRGGSVYKWHVESIEQRTGAHINRGHGTCVERDLAQHRAEHHAERLHEERQPS